MAQVAQEITERADHFLDYLFAEWESVSEYAEEFDAWDETRQLVFVHEWDIREGGLQILGEYAEQGLLTPFQYDRYRELLQLVARQRPTIARLLQE